jgi:hypothetical protein
MRGCVATWVVPLLLAAVAASASTGDELTAWGPCREGLPNGPYELHDATGRLRAVGAFHMGRRAGTFIFWTRAGSRLAVVPYDEDERTGTVALWYEPARTGADAVRRLEAPHVRGQLHGVKRSWHPNGRRRAEFRYEHGRLAEARAWDADARPLTARDAEALAARDEKAEAEILRSLERLVREHTAACS